MTVCFHVSYDTFQKSSKQKKSRRILKTIDTSESSDNEQEHIRRPTKRRQSVLCSSEDEDQSADDDPNKQSQRSTDGQSNQRDMSLLKEATPTNYKDTTMGTIISDINSNAGLTTQSKCSSVRATLSESYIREHGEDKTAEHTETSTFIPCVTGTDDSSSQSDSDDIHVCAHSVRANVIDSSSSNDESNGRVNQRLKSPRVELMKDRKEKWRSGVLANYESKRKKGMCKEGNIG